jgi:hypothetical protein
MDARTTANAGLPALYSALPGRKSSALKMFLKRQRHRCAAWLPGNWFNDFKNMEVNLGEFDFKKTTRNADAPPAE